MSREASQLTKPLDFVIDCSYQRQVNRYSDMWRSDDRSGFDEAIYWIELLIKYGNFDHLQINDRHLNLLQYFSVDVIAFYFLILTAWAYLTIRVCRKKLGNKAAKTEIDLKKTL